MTKKNKSDNEFKVAQIFKLTSSKNPHLIEIICAIVFILHWLPIKFSLMQ